MYLNPIVKEQHCLSICRHWLSQKIWTANSIGKSGPERCDVACVGLGRGGSPFLHVSKTKEKPIVYLDTIVKKQHCLAFCRYWQSMVGLSCI